jgi:hypothetical protein
VTAGKINTAVGEGSAVHGGGGESNLGNTAFANYSSILGGYRNETGYIVGGDHEVASYSCIVGGRRNWIQGECGAILGGYNNHIVYGQDGTILGDRDQYTMKDYQVAPLNMGPPAYDSGWVALSKDERKTLTHNLGADPDEYVVDIQSRNNENGSRSIYAIGSRSTWNLVYNSNSGFYWHSLNKNEIGIYRGGDDENSDKVRVRIWMVKRY